MKSTGAVGFISLGCPKALVDSEQIISELRSEGYSITPSYHDADVVVVNTCGFIDDAVAESLDAIGEAMNKNGKVIVTGCLGAREGLVEARFPDLLAVTGPHAKREVLDAIHATLPPKHDPHIDLLPPGGIKLTPRHYAYLKISEGCNHRCTFCIIPSLRGDLVSRPVCEVITEAEALVSAGVKELLVVSQDTSAYGVDTKYRTDLCGSTARRTHIVDLAEALGELGVWVRLHYVYPYPHVDKLIPLMADGKILPYLDIPLQHASPRILKAMRRPAHAEKALRRIEAWRQDCPDITLRSTFIVGFPGETEDDFAELMTFLEAAQLDRVGVFAYSPVDGASANALANPVDEAVKQERLKTVMALQAEISAQRLQNKIGSQTRAIIDEVGENGFIGRTQADSPEVDGVVHIFADPSSTRHGLVKSGDWVNIQITAADEHDLEAELIVNSTAK